MNAAAHVEGDFADGRRKNAVFDDTASADRDEESIGIDIATLADGLQPNEFGMLDASSVNGPGLMLLSPMANATDAVARSPRSA